MRSLWLLNELYIPFELVDMPFDLKVMRSAEYLAVHPLGRVPCLVDGAFRLFESGAIAEYLCERYPQAGLGRLAGHRPDCHCRARLVGIERRRACAGGCACQARRRNLRA